MKYNSDTPDHILKEYIGRIESHWKQLNDLVLSVASDGIKYLFYVNAGGCVAVIAFIGTSDSIRRLNWPWNILCLFFLGLLFVGILNFSRYHIIDSLLSKWQKDVAIFYNGDIDFDVISDRDDARVDKSQWILLFAYASFACFIAGGIVGFVNYKELIKGQPEMTVNIKPTLQMTSEQKNHVPKQSPVPPTPQPAK